MSPLTPGAYTTSTRGSTVTVSLIAGRLHPSVWQSFPVTLVGVLVALVGALGVGKGAQSILFQMSGADPAVLALSALALALVALCAGFIPAHRASRVDPMRALKYE
jgi:ABC-type lipoprotein release transport system permease subunit